MIGRRSLGLAVSLLLAACIGSSDDGPAAAFGDPLPGLGEREQGRFLLGRAVFERLATADEGLGPLYNATRCSGCHDAPTSGGTSGQRVVKATRFDPTDASCDLLHDRGGDNIQQLATARLVELGIGPEVIPDEANNRAVVLAPSLYGLGLIEATPLAALERRADPDDVDGDGISGRVGLTPDGRPGRFGRKAEVATLAEFVDMALRFELGFTTPMHPVEETRNGVPLPAEADPMGEPEIDERGVALLTDYVRYLAPPPRQVQPTRAARDSVESGEHLFEEVGCASCHTPEIRTRRDEIDALSNIRVHAFSDFLLHDLGPEMAGVCGPAATPTEHRTARLWGLRLRSSFMHDGRARSIEAAIDLHGGEAAAARRAFTGLTGGDRRTLLRFLLSL